MLLDIQNLRSGYGGFEVLRGVDFKVESGEIVALIGPNGAGKSTVLKSVAGLAGITSGQIIWKGRDITRLPTHLLLKQGIGFVPQGRLIFQSLTVLENLEMGGYLLGRSAALKKNLRLVFGLFPTLQELAAAKAGSLSGGQQQMLAIGRALMTSPRLLMLDEPSLGLSPKVTSEVFEKLKHINSLGTAIMIVEQNVKQVLKYAHRGYLLVAGQIRHSGTALELSDEKLMHEAYLV